MIKRPLLSLSRAAGAVLLVTLLAALSLTAPTEVQAQESPSPFTIDYPTDARPFNIVRNFNATGLNGLPFEGMDLYTPAGAHVLAGAGGKIKKVVAAEDGRGWGAYVMVKTEYNGVKYRVTYGHLNPATIIVSKGQVVSTGEVLALAAGTDNRISVIIQANSGGRTGYNVSEIINPKKHLKIPGFRLQPTDNGLRLRAAPSTDADILGKVNQWDLLQTPLTDYKALWLAGQDGKWVEVIGPNGQPAYVAAQYVKVISKDDGPGGIVGIPLRGMNVDLYQTNGAPPAEPLSNLGWVRINFNVSFNPENGTFGNTDVGAAFARYYPMVKQYALNGNKIILVMTHQFYGEGAGFHWEQMDTGKWQALSNRYAQMASQAAALFGSENLVYAYQIWNEQDTQPQDARAAVPIPASDYANLFTQAALAIRAADPGAKVITGGHITGNALGPQYARQVLGLLPEAAYPDGIAFHPYGLGPVGSPYNVFGTINDAIVAWSTVLPNRPLWITEWGVLDHQGDDSLAAPIATHAQGFMSTLEMQFPGMVAAAVWYAWADGMDNGYGMVNVNNQPKEPLYSSYLNATSSMSLVNGVLPLPGTFSTSAGISTIAPMTQDGTIPLPVAP
jgi:hypothetical protein